ncbi:DUF2868 domain-containing protein [Ideonella sp.]|uniref:DUF2868 domain-containing protein n=1 Tax=Ideonella sp. TaxID=1929293 RepID=UPI0035AF3FF2
MTERLDPPAPAAGTALPPGPGWDAMLLRAVRAAELAGAAVDDQPAMAQAAALPGAPAVRLARRARLLAGPLGVEGPLRRARRALPWLLAAAAGLAGLLGAHLLERLAGEGRHLNAVGAVALALALPTLSLVLWGLALASGRLALGGGLAGWTLAAAARLPGLRGPAGVTWLPVAWQALAEARLLPWALGLVQHLLWLGVFTVLLAGLLVDFGLRAYTLGWETTILPAGFFAQVVQVLGAGPAALGFPVPDAAAVAAAQAAPGQGPPGDPRPWVGWLIGCLVVYGALPRGLAAAACLSVWRRRRHRLAGIDPADPYWRRLLDRLAAAEAPRVADAERRPPRAARAAVPPAHGAPALVGFELPPQAPWPPAGLMAALPAWCERLDGSAEDRQALRERAQLERPARLLLVVHGPATPDRGTARVLAGVAQAGSAVALLAQGAGAARWRAWLADPATAVAGAPPDVPVFDDAAAAGAWLHGRAGAAGPRSGHG